MGNDVAVRDHLDLLVLAVLQKGPAHGYAVIEELRRRSAGAFDLPEGTVYPALHRLERAELLSSSWTSGEGRPRRVYRLTPAGRRELKRKRDDWHGFVASVSRVLAPVAPR